MHAREDSEIVELTPLNPQAMEICGYACRLVSHFQPFRTDLYIAQYILIVLAPLLFQAALYVALSQALRRLDCTGRSLLHFNPKILVYGESISLSAPASIVRLTWSDLSHRSCIQ